MKPLLYHVEYHIQNGYFDKFPKGQEIRMVVGTDGGVQTIHGSGTGSGKVMFSSGKAVLFALDKMKEELKVVFRAYSEDKFLGESVKIFKGTSFPKRTEVGEPASYTYNSDLGFRKCGELVGAIKSFIRMTSFGENIISDCIKDGDSFRVRMTSMIVERNKDPRKNVKPWWVILDGRRLRFSRWLRTLEKEDCTKDVFLKVRKCPEDDNEDLSQEDEIATDTVEAALKKDFDFIREYGFQEMSDKASQVNFNNDFSLSEIYTLQINSKGGKTSKNVFFDENIVSSSCSMQDKGKAEKFVEKDEVKNSFDEVVQSPEKQSDITQRPCGVELNESGFPVSVNNRFQNNLHQNLVFFSINDPKKFIDESEKYVVDHMKTNDESNVKNYKNNKADDIFHFERSTSDFFIENPSTESSRAASVVSDETRGSDAECEAELTTVTDRSFLAETIVREIINITIERVVEREYCSLEEHDIEELIIASKEGSNSKVIRFVGYGDTESLMDLSVLGISKPTQSIDPSAPRNINIISDCSVTRVNDEEKLDLNNPKTKINYKTKMPSELDVSHEEFLSKNRNESMMTNDLQQNDQNDIVGCLYSVQDLCIESCYGKKEFKGLRSSLLSQIDIVGSFKPNVDNQPTVDNSIIGWLKEDVISSCFPHNNDLNDVKNAEQAQESFQPKQPTKPSTFFPEPGYECFRDITYFSKEIPLLSLTKDIPQEDGIESCSSNTDNITTISSPVPIVRNDENQKNNLTDEFQNNAIKSQVIDHDARLKETSPLKEDCNPESSGNDDGSSLPEHDLQK